MRELQFIVDFVFGLLVGAFLLRLLLQFFRADFRNPFAQAIVRLTNPLVLPLRKVLPAVGRLDTASAVAVVLVQAVRTLLSSLLLAGAVPPIGILVIGSVLAILDTILIVFLVAIFIYVILSWVSPDGYTPAGRLLGYLVEPLLAPLRRALPSLGGLDLSPIVAILLISVIRMVLNGRIAPLLLGIG